MRCWLRISVLLGALGSGLAACGPGIPEGPVHIAVIDEAGVVAQDDAALSVAALHVRAATREGLVSLDASGQIVPGLAERWIVTDDGLSYIFRVRERSWPDGEPIGARDIAASLKNLLEQFEGTSLGLDLAKITEVRAMTEKVIELRLSSPMPDFLRLLAQPEMGIERSGLGAGPMALSLDEEEPVTQLRALPPQERGLAPQQDWEATSRSLELRLLPAKLAIEAFSQGEVDLVLNGSLVSFPRVELGPLSRGTVQVDPSLGLFGLAFKSDAGILEDPEIREALSMALDRAALIEPFGLGGWQPTTWIVPPAILGPAQAPASRWADLSLEERREIAKDRFDARRAASGEEEIVLRVAMPAGPGSDLLFAGLVRDWQSLGVRVVRVEPGVDAQLEWMDRLARYSSPRWYLNQFNCRLDGGLCSAEADEIVRSSLEMTDPLAKREMLAEAHSVLIDEEVFIPLGAPVRWSLVRGSIANYQPNQWGLHPLFPLSTRSN